MKETIEEAAKNYANYNEQINKAVQEAVKFGAKWQQEQDKNKFSEEEVELLIDFVKDCATNWDCDNDSDKYNTPCRMCEAEKVLEQFKKK
jgi:hypothetical protein